MKHIDLELAEQLSKNTGKGGAPTQSKLGRRRAQGLLKRCGITCLMLTLLLTVTLSG